MRFVVDKNTLAVGKVMQQLRDDVAYVGDPLISDLIPRRSLDKHWQSVERFIAKNPAGPWWLSLTDSGWRQLDYRPDKPLPYHGPRDQVVREVRAVGATPLTGTAGRIEGRHPLLDDSGTH